MKPIIAINVDIEDGPPEIAVVQSTYFRAVLNAGGIPVLLPPMSDGDMDLLFKQINGLMLIGGRDYSPEHWGEPACEKVKLTSRAREDWDLRLVRRAVLQSDLPLLGICAGAQILNIGLGGSLIQDIPSEFPDSKVDHSSSSDWGKYKTHDVKIAPGTKLSKIYTKKELAVPTSHHQSVKQLGTGLQAAAHAHDGIIEAIELTEKPFTIGVQWHPERDYEGNKELFETFVKHAARVTISV